MKFPFASGSTWKVLQGYNTSPREGGSHWNCDPATLKDAISQSQSCNAGWQYKYSLDLVRADGQTAGQDVLSPVNGTIRWIDQSTGGMSINLGDGYAFAFFHANLAAGLAEGQPVSVGQVLGTVAPSGVANNGGTPHLHITVWQTNDGGNWSRNGQPMTGALSIDGYSFPDLGASSRNQHQGQSVVSSNTAVGGGNNGTPAPPTLLSPTNGAKITNSDGKVAFSWNPVAGATQYQVAINDFNYGPWISGTSWTSDSLAAGNYFWRVRARNSAGIGLLSPSWTFTVAPSNVTPPPAGGLSLSLDPARGNVGAAVMATGSGFAANENVTLRWGSASGTLLTTVRASSNGTFSTQLTIPEAPAGDRAIYATGASSSRQTTATYGVTPSLARNPTQGVPGTLIAVTVRGFGANEDVRLNWTSASGPVLGTVRTNGNGTGTINITLPAGAPGWTDYTGVGLTSGVRAWGAINVLSSVVLSPSSASVGSSVTASGVGFPSGQTATVVFNKQGGNA
ncbi:MAG TPA: M23 family metallopeptidase, partial [Thermomicrobiales bacterium]|nr:M23 family metallopeptidase [Thermomicrobiales bacterium]